MTSDTPGTPRTRRSVTHPTNTPEARPAEGPDHEAAKTHAGEILAPGSNAPQWSRNLAHSHRALAMQVKRLREALADLNERGDLACIVDPPCNGCHRCTARTLFTEAHGK